MEFWHYQILQNLPFHNTTANIKQIHPNKIMLSKALCEQLPQHAKSAILNAQCHTKQHANSTTAKSNDHTNHSVADTLPRSTSNSVHYMPIETAPHLMNLLHYLIPYYHPHAVLLVICTLSMLPAMIVSYTPMVLCTLLMWSMSPTGVHKHCPFPLDHLLMVEAIVV